MLKQQMGSESDLQQFVVEQLSNVSLTVGSPPPSQPESLPKYRRGSERQRKVSATFMSIDQLREAAGGNKKMMHTTGQIHEDDIAEVVIVCEPDLNNNVMGSIHPHGALYEKPVNVEVSRDQHRRFREAIRENGVHCLTVHQILMHDTDCNLRARHELEELAATRLTYTLDKEHSADDLKEEDTFYLGEKYKSEVLAEMSTEHLIDMILTVPTVHLKPSLRDTGFTASYQFNPLTNMQYTRDQQITTAKGIVMGRLRSLQRQNEVELMEFCFKKLGLDIAGTVRHPGFLEGGDFYPAGKDLCMLGVGLRSNVEAAEQLMREDLFGTTRVAVVEDRFEQDQARMHLDCIFNIIGKNIVVLADDVIGEDKPLRRLVTEYERSDNPDHHSPALGCYRISRREVEFSKYLEDNGYHIIKLTREEQLEYGCNVLNLGHGNIISCHREASRKIIKDPKFKGRMQVVPFNSITSMYGGLHCSSQVVRRISPAPKRAVGGFDKPPLASGLNFK
uniref:Arginine deiminase n=1 Tax=Pyramimonas obovata TaxID=1411642 RepID=A0A7S0WP51_9CHLO|mmetsp:Transcript_331/g.763  ORF Transcript_331/g.763 Transcript_331/m.763 type:complete len:505 (+) Transcript_331:243-1757(+)